MDIDEMQFGLMPGCSASGCSTNAIFILSQLGRNIYQKKKKKNLPFAFVCLDKACDRELEMLYGGLSGY